MQLHDVEMTGKIIYMFICEMLNSCQEVKRNKSEMPLLYILTQNYSFPLTINDPLSVTPAGKDLLGSGLTH